MLIFTRDIKTKELFKGRLRRAAADVKDFLLFEHIRLTGIIKGEPGRKIFESNGEFKVRAIRDGPTVLCVEGYNKR